GAPAVRSDLRAEYTVLMPAGNPLQVVNAYGQTELSDLSGVQKLEQNFGKISLRNLRGTLTATARYADLGATNVQADFTCEANKSTVQLLGLGGSCFVRNYYGSVRVQPAAGLRKLTVEADRTEVIISAAEPELFSYQLNVLQGELVVPAAYAAAKKASATRASLTTKPAAGHRPLLLLGAGLLVGPAFGAAAQAVSDTTRLHYSEEAAGRYYYNRERRVLQGKNVGNFSANYLSVALGAGLGREAHETPNFLYRNDSRQFATADVALLYGLQRRLGRRGFVDANAGVATLL
nr:hypothetical protein [Tanacetum cinerariifolium]